MSGTAYGRKKFHKSDLLITALDQSRFSQSMVHDYDVDQEMDEVLAAETMM